MDRMMKNPEMFPTPLPDVAVKQDRQFYKPIDWVGMGAVKVPLRIPSGSLALQLIAQLQILVSLDLSPSRGIHMSRLYALAQSLSQSVLTLAALKQICKEMINSQNQHQMLSSAARLTVDFELPVQRKSLKSELLSWKVYPVSMTLQQRATDECLVLVEVKITYSSTCPASAALARDLNSQNFRAHYEQQHRAFDLQDATQFLVSEPGMIATPHAQRSEAHVQMLVHSDFELNQIEHMITVLEDALGTPVQGAVKREDEQEFARLNGTHLMFCEDAVRTLGAALDHQKSILGYKLHVSHFESLHAHNAVSILQKNFIF